MTKLSSPMIQTVIAFLNEEILGNKVKKDCNSYYGFGFKHPVPRPFLSAHELAKALSVSEPTLERWRRQGLGPPFIKVGNKRIRYPITELDLWVRKSLINQDSAESATTTKDTTESN